MNKLLILIVSFVFALQTKASLQVFPLRVFLDEKEKSAQISVRHNGDKTTKYRITSIFYQMSTDGSMKELKSTTDKDLSAAGLIRYSPKEVTLEPKVEQIVRVLLRLPANLADGEYRTHLHFEEVDQVDTSEKAGSNSDKSQLSLKAHLAVAIPVIVRKGQATFKVTLQNLKLLDMPDKKKGFAVELLKEGNAFAYGDIEVQSVSESGETKVIGQMNGISSYIDKRVVSYPLEVDKIPAGKVRVLFKQPAAQGGAILSSTDTSIK